ncbi:MAG: glutathione S-transferase family protein, partial [Pseudomonadota bacterium]
MALPTPVKLYDQARAPNPMRVNLFLAEKGVEIPRENVDLMAGDHKTPAYLAAVGAPVCPALVLSDGSVLTETQAICRYLEALYPEPNMLGHDPLEAAEIEMWQRRVEFGLWAAVGSCFRHTNPHMAVMEDQVPAWGEINRDRIAGHLQSLEARLAGRDWLAADRFTIADITGYLAVG